MIITLTKEYTNISNEYNTMKDKMGEINLVLSKLNQDSEKEFSESSEDDSSDDEENHLKKKKNQKKVN